MDRKNRPYLKDTKRQCFQSCLFFCSLEGALCNDALCWPILWCLAGGPIPWCHAAGGGPYPMVYLGRPIQRSFVTGGVGRGLVQGSDPMYILRKYFSLVHDSESLQILQNETNACLHKAKCLTVVWQTQKFIPENTMGNLVYQWNDHIRGCSIMVWRIVFI